MYIYFRCCEKQDTISYVDRWNNYPKTEILKKCWVSLQQSITEEDKTTVIADQLSDDTKEFLEKTHKAGLLSFVEVPEKQEGNTDHLHTMVLIDTLEKDLKNLNDTDVCYLVEDDYLHTFNALNVMREIFKYWKGFAVTYDYPDRYKENSPSMVFVGPDRHWKTIQSCPFTIAGRAEYFNKIMDYLKKAAPTSNDKIFEILFNTIPCINPLPALSTHLTQYHMSPLIDWQSIWDSIVLEENA